MEHHDGPILIKSCCECSWLSYEYDMDDPYEHIPICEHPSRLNKPNTDMVLDAHLVTPDDCPFLSGAELISSPKDEEDEDETRIRPLSPVG